MSFKIEETFTVRAPVDRVFGYLIDPHQVVMCLPGAELTGVEGDTTYLGRVKVKVGPVVATYSGRVTIAELDAAAHRVQMLAEGRETGGSGSAKMRLTSRVEAQPDGTSRVSVEADLDVAGKIVQFGRGMIDTVNQQLFRQFTECARATLETSVAPVEGAPSMEAAADATRVAAPALPHHAEPVQIVPLLLRAFAAWIRRLFHRA